MNNLLDLDSLSLHSILRVSYLVAFARRSPSSLSLQNFYGFRKIKSDPLRLRDAVADTESKFWKFRHEKFQQGRPDLLSEIRKSNHTEAADKKEVDALRSEVYELRSKLNTMAKDMERLTSLLQSVVAAPALTDVIVPPPSKKRKITPLPSPVGSYESTSQIAPEPMAVTSLPAVPITNVGAVGKSPSSDKTLTSSNFTVVVPAESGVPKIPPIPSPTTLSSANFRDESLTCLSIDDEMLTSLFALDPSSSHPHVAADDDAILIDNPEEFGIYNETTTAVPSAEISLDVLDQLDEPLMDHTMEP